MQCEAKSLNIIAKSARVSLFSALHTNISIRTRRNTEWYRVRQKLIQLAIHFT